MKNKICLYCKKEKSITDFYIIKSKIDYYCKYCRNKNSILGQNNNKKKCSLESCARPHYAKDLCRVHYARKLRTGVIEREQTDIDKVYKYRTRSYKYRDSRINHLMRTYKITMAQFDEMAKNGCWICGATNSGIKRLHVEHDHKCCGTNISCGKCIRGIVCNRCNMLIGKYEKNTMRDDNPYKDKVITYLLNYKARKHLL